jgi:exopolyphosphatase/guanosine-5'-triphosphate,3'-diphosphate pyrophosphatase
MAAILRVADSLDRGHSQRIRGITLEKRDNTLVIHSGSPEASSENSRINYRDFSLEQIGLKEKAGLFQDVFGYKVILE